MYLCVAQQLFARYLHVDCVTGTMAIYYWASSLMVYSFSHLILAVNLADRLAFLSTPES